MTAPELRVGNIVEYKSKALFVESINKDGINLIGSDDFFIYPVYEFGELHPIKISKQWLLSFGFRGYDGHYFQINDIIEIYMDRFTFEMWIGVNSNFSIHHVKYIHELQNLYYALTGKELVLADSLL